ncbi:MAG: hypothetical protein D6754_07380 [Alphaproteobacteria bacterium]|nr:MAG: hypothetical protein D6754_07380 [Alphaproteobacteria bacterium]
MEQKRGLIGIQEKANPNTVWQDHCPWEAENALFAADDDRVLPWPEAALERMPVLAERGICRLVHGAAEAHASRNAAGLMGISSFAEIEVTGPGAGTFLDALAPNRLSREGRTALELIIHGQPRPGRVLVEPAFDPHSLRPRADTPLAVFYG